MRFLLLLGDLPPPTPTLVRSFELPQPETIWIAGVALALAAFLTLLGLLSKRGRRRAGLVASLAAAVVLGLTAFAAQHSAKQWRLWEQQRGGGPPPDWDRGPPPWEQGPAVAPPP